MKKTLKYTVITLGIITSFIFTAYSFRDNLLDVGKNIEVFAVLYKQVSQNYVGDVDNDKIIRKGIDAMLNELDPYTEFIPAAEMDAFKVKYISTQYSGLGAVIFSKGQNAYISEPYEGYPAAKSGLRAGDQLVKVDSVFLGNLSNSEISNLLKGPKGSTMRLEVSRTGEKEPIVKEIVREEIHQPNVSYAKVMNDHIGYIKLDRFLENAADEVAKSIETMQAKGQLNGIVLDLRDNGGGILQESVKIVSLFVDSGSPVVSQKGNNSRKQFTYHTSGKALLVDVPLIVLINGKSASAAEIVAGALQDLDRAVIIGQRSFGKGLVQQTFRLPYENMVKVTVAKYYTPSGRCIQAIDYDKKATMESRVKLAEYKTKNGRLVYDNSGISPDIEVDSESYSELTQALINHYLIFDFATQYRYEHKSIPKTDKFVVDDLLYQQFVGYVDSIDFNYDSRSETLLKHLRVALEKEGKLAGANAELQSLSKKLKKDVVNDLYRYKTEIAPLLTKEIVSRYYYQKGKMEVALAQDEVIKKAKTLIFSTSYATILEGVGEYRSIGKPNVTFAVNEKN